MALPKIVVLSSSLLNDRMILYNDFLNTLSKKAEVYIWPTAWDKPAYENVNIPHVHVERFPKVNEMKFRLTLLRRINDYTWDAKNLSASRKSFWLYTRIGNVPKSFEYMYSAGKVLNRLGLARIMERLSEPVYIREQRSKDAYDRLKKLNPDVVVTMSPFFAIEPGIVSEAKKLKIPVLAFITSWDNITTKNRLMFNYEGYILWSEQMKRDLNTFYPQSIGKPTYIVGAPQYDVFRNPEYYQSKEEFCKENGLDPAKPIVLYALGSPNLFDEFPGAIEFLKRAAKGDMGDVQVIVRPHPLKFSDPGLFDLPKIYNKILIQTSNPKQGEKVFTHDKAKIHEWLNTYKHSDVIIQLGSTVAVDASILDTPIINIDFDPSGKKDQLVKDLNHIMNHFAPLTAFNGMWEVHNYDEMVEAVNGYIKDRSLHHEGRKKIAEFVCQYTDGKCGERFAEALADFAGVKSVATI
jgi:hypothetical protein